MQPSSFSGIPARRSQNGFTLIEILIVVIILGILATIVIAQFNNVRGNAADVALKDNLHWMRSAIMLYQEEHGSFPTLASFEGQMTEYTDATGNVSTSKDSTYKYGSYMVSVPQLPVGAQSGQAGVTGTTYAAGYGWEYDESTGSLHANCQASEVDQNGTPYNTY